MIVIKVEQYNSAQFQEALTKLATAGGFDFTTTVSVKNTLKALSDEVRALMNHKEKMVSELAEKDEKGFPKVKKVPSPQDEKQMIDVYDLTPENEEKAKKIHSEFLAQEIKLERMPLKASKVCERAHLSAQDLASLTGLIDEEA